jgi:hypothetical protein
MIGLIELENSIMIIHLQFLRGGSKSMSLVGETVMIFVLMLLVNYLARIMNYSNIFLNGLNILTFV